MESEKPRVKQDHNETAEQWYQ